MTTPPDETTAPRVLMGSMQNAGDLADFAVPGPDLDDACRQGPVPLASILAWVSWRRATGRLVVGGPSGGTLLAEHGAIVAAERAAVPFAEAFLEVVSRDFHVLPEAIAAARKASAASGRSVLTLLYEAKACTPKTLVEAIRATKNATIQAFLEVPQANWAWKDGPVPGPRPDPVTLDLAVLLTSLFRERTRTSYAPDLEPLLAATMSLYPVPSESLTPELRQACLLEKEHKVIEDVTDGSTTVHDAFATSVLSRTQTARLFVLCNLLGFMEYRSTGIPKGGVEMAIAGLQRDLDRTRGEDFFTRLGIHWTTHPDRIRPAFLHMKDRWGPRSQHRALGPEAERIADAMMGLMEEAVAAIERQDARRAYRARTLGDSKMRYGTELLFKQAHMAIFREDAPLAKELIESAIDIQPDPVFLSFRQKLEPVLKH